MLKELTGKFFISLVSISLMGCAITDARANEFADTLQSLLPSWPLSQPGDPIPVNVIAGWRGDLCKGRIGAYPDFPSKGNKCEVAANLSDSAIANMPPTRQCPGYTKNVDAYDSGDICDDGDQTSYNGLLCASGDEAGCQAVADAQDPASGRWFRSPHRRWVWFNRCFNSKEPFGVDKASPNDPLAQKAAQKQKFNDECAYGFSPDMNLGVLLYTLHSRDIGRYRGWLAWLDENAKTTKLCKLDGDTVSDCITGIYWPRVCTDDLGNLNPGHSPGVSIFGRYGGQCVLRPFDTLDFSAVNHALNVAPPAGLAKWDIDARILIDFAEGVVARVPAAGPLISATPPLILTSSVENSNFPIHLDAERVLIRMMIRNPSLKLDSLPDLPDPSEIVPKPDSLSVSDGDDLATIKIASRIIADRVPWDPFYQLLANGPTPTVRQLIFDHCPAPEDISEKSDWIWEKADDVDGSRFKSMGWDCVFVANLYNRMRVRKDISDALLQQFMKYADVLGNALTQAQRALTMASAGSKAAEQALAASKSTLEAAHTFVEKQYPELKDELNGQLNQVESVLTSINSNIADISTDIVNKTSALSRIPDTISDIIGSKRVCVLPLPFHKCGKWVDNPISRLIPNPAKTAAIEAIDELGRQKAAMVATLNAPLQGEANLRKQISELDKKFQAVKSQVESGTLDLAVSTAEAGLREHQKLLAVASKTVTAVSNTNKTVKNYVCVWKSDAKCSD